MENLLAQERKAILDRWKKSLLEAYPTELTSFLTGVDDRFRNPVGYTLVQGLDRIYESLAGWAGDGTAESAIEDIIRIRAVQDFSPSDAVGFMMPLKAFVGEAAEKAGRKGTAGTDAFRAEVARVETEIDRMTLFAVDCYVKCREAIFQVRVREASAGGMMGASVMRRRIR